MDLLTLVSDVLGKAQELNRHETFGPLGPSPLHPAYRGEHEIPEMAPHRDAYEEYGPGYLQHVPQLQDGWHDLHDAMMENFPIYPDEWKGRDGWETENHEQHEQYLEAISHHAEAWNAGGKRMNDAGWAYTPGTQYERSLHGQQTANRWYRRNYGAQSGLKSFTLKATHSLRFIAQAVKDDPYDEAATAALHDAIRDVSSIEPAHGLPPLEWRGREEFQDVNHPYHNDLHEAYMAAHAQWHNQTVDRLQPQFLEHFPEHPDWWESQQPHASANWSNEANPRHRDYRAANWHHQRAWAEFRHGPAWEEALQWQRDHNSDINEFHHAANQWYRNRIQEDPRAFQQRDPVQMEDDKSFTLKAAPTVTPPDDYAQGDNHSRILAYHNLAGVVQPNAGYPITWDGFQGAYDPAHPHHEAYQAATRQHNMNRMTERFPQEPKDWSDEGKRELIHHTPSGAVEWSNPTHPRHQEYRDWDNLHSAALNGWFESPEWHIWSDDGENTLQAYNAAANAWFHNNYGTPQKSFRLKSVPENILYHAMLSPGDKEIEGVFHDALIDNNVYPEEGVHPEHWSGFAGAKDDLNHPLRNEYMTAVRRHVYPHVAVNFPVHPSDWTASVQGTPQESTDAFPWETDANHWSHSEHPEHQDYLDAVAFHQAALRRMEDSGAQQDIRDRLWRLRGNMTDQQHGEQDDLLSNQWLRQTYEQPTPSRKAFPNRPQLAEGEQTVGAWLANTPPPAPPEQYVSLNSGADFTNPHMAHPLRPLYQTNPDRLGRYSAAQTEDMMQSAIQPDHPMHPAHPEHEQFLHAWQIHAPVPVFPRNLHPMTHAMLNWYQDRAGRNANDPDYLSEWHQENPQFRAAYPMYTPRIQGGDNGN